MANKPFYGRWGDHPTIKTKKGRCSFCRKPNRIVAPMTNGQQFCGSCMVHVLHILNGIIDDALRFPFAGSTWEKYIENGKN